MPVLPATFTPGTAAPMPVPSVTTERMARAMKRAVSGVVARSATPPAPLSSVGFGRRPPWAIAEATSAISSGVASTLPWPIAVEPTARSSPISAAAGIVERAAPGSPGSSLKPNFSAAATSRSAPSSAPSGAKTELQDSAKEARSEPPQASPLAFSSSTPSSDVLVSTGNFASA